MKVVEPSLPANDAHLVDSQYLNDTAYDDYVEWGWTNCNHHPNCFDSEGNEVPVLVIAKGDRTDGTQSFGLGNPQYLTVGEHEFFAWERVFDSETNTYTYKGWIHVDNPSMWIKAGEITDYPKYLSVGLEAFEVWDSQKSQPDFHVPDVRWGRDFDHVIVTGDDGNWSHWEQDTWPSFEIASADNYNLTWNDQWDDWLVQTPQQ